MSVIATECDFIYLFDFQLNEKISKVNLLATSDRIHEFKDLEFFLLATGC